MTAHQPKQLVDHLFRHEYGKLVAVLSRFLGLSHLEAVEDIVQETFIKAIQTWRPETIPDNPAAWLTTVAKRKAIDYIRKTNSSVDRAVQVSLSGPSSAYIEELFMDSEISDSQLRMIFACCHPELAAQDQIALTLKVVSGFSLKEIARALLTNAEKIRKRIQRAKKFLKDNELKLTIPSGNDLKLRLEKVHHVLYLIFNEGHYSSNNLEHIRRDLCMEAMRLCKLTTQHEFTQHPDNLALMALMCYHASRFDSRMDVNDNVILLKNQDRALWDQELINVGHYHFFKAFKTGPLSTYHWQAAISSEHARAAKFEDTDWTSILTCYQHIHALNPTDVVLMNQVVVLMQLSKLQDAEVLFEKLDVTNCPAVLFYSIGAELYIQLNNKNLANHYLDQAEASSPTQSELTILSNKRKNIESISNS